MTRLATDINRHAVDTVLPKLAGTQAVAFNDATPASITLLSGAPEIGREVVFLLSATNDCRIALAASGSTYANAAAMAAEFVLLANQYLKVSVAYPGRSKVWVIARDSSDTGTLYASQTADA